MKKKDITINAYHAGKSKSQILLRKKDNCLLIEIFRIFFLYIKFRYTYTVRDYINM